jgi:hypothetical protein
VLVSGLMGEIQGVGLDRAPGSGGIFGPYRIIVSTAVSPVYDLMSYCTGGDDADAWISVRYWTLFLVTAPLR